MFITFFGFFTLHLWTLNDEIYCMMEFLEDFKSERIRSIWAAKLPMYTQNLLINFPHFNHESTWTWMLKMYCIFFLVEILVCQRLRQNRPKWTQNWLFIFFLKFPHYILVFLHKGKLSELLQSPAYLLGYIESWLFISAN